MKRLAEKINGVISELKNAARAEGEKDGIKKGRKDIINRLLEKFTSDDVSEMLEIEKTALLNMLEKRDIFSNTLSIIFKNTTTLFHSNAFFNCIFQIIYPI